MPLDAVGEGHLEGRGDAVQADRHLLFRRHVGVDDLKPKAELSPVYVPRLHLIRSFSGPNAMHRKFRLLSEGKASSHSTALPSFFCFFLCAVFSCFHNPPNSDMDYRIFNVRTF